MSDNDLYKILGIDESASIEEIEAAFRRAAQYWHPDRNKSPNAAEMMAVVNEARDVLSDKVRRFDYDRQTRPQETVSSSTRTAAHSSASRNVSSKERRSNPAPRTGKRLNPISGYEVPEGLVWVMLVVLLIASFTIYGIASGT